MPKNRQMIFSGFCGGNTKPQKLILPKHNAFCMPEYNFVLFQWLILLLEAGEGASFRQFDPNMPVGVIFSTCTLLWLELKLWAVKE
jgi:hypothetical protein